MSIENSPEVNILVQRIIKKVNAFLDKNSIDHAAFSRAIGKSVSYTGKLLSGKCIPTLPTIVEIARYIGLTPEELLLDDDEVITPTNQVISPEFAKLAVTMNRLIRKLDEDERTLLGQYNNALAQALMIK